MHSIRIVPAIAAAVLIGLSGIAAHAQEPPREAQELFTELQQIQQRLATIQDQAIEKDTALKRQQDDLQELVFSTMVRLHPEVESTLARMDALQSEFQQAQEAEDTARLQAIVAEAQQLQQGVARAQADALEQEEVAAAVARFESNLLNKMSEIEPETPTLLARAEAIASRLQAMQPS